MRRRQDESGGITVIAAALMGLAALLILAIAASATIRAHRTYAQAVADLAALSAGPDLLRGCLRAGEIAARNGVQLAECERLALDLRVRVTVPVLGIGEVSARARAAPIFAPP